MNENSKIIYTGDHVLDIMSAYAVNRNNCIEKLIRNAFHIDTMKVKKKFWTSVQEKESSSTGFQTCRI